MVKGERKAGWIIGILVLLFLGGAVWTLYTTWRSSAKVLIGDTVVEAKLATSDEERARGLAGVTNLGSREGMLFVFPKDDYWKVWMKDMRIPIDVVWLDKDKKVVHITKNVAPETYPQTFEPKNPARYVLELPAGTVEPSKISIGKQATFELPKR